VISGHRSPFVGLGTIVLLLALVRPAPGQSPNAGSLRGTVVDEAGTPLVDAVVSVVRAGSGVHRVVHTDRAGRFVATFLPSGRYEAVVERLGYRPQRIVGLVVASGRDTEVTVRLAAARPPIEAVDTVRFQAGAVIGSRPDMSRPFDAFELEGVPDAARRLEALSRMATTSDAGLRIEGLPARLTAVVVDGVPFSPARHPYVDDPFPASAFPPSALRSAELVTNGVDVEWADAAAGHLGVQTTAGTRELAVRAFGAWSGDALSSSRHFDAAEAPYTSLRGGVVASGPLFGDTAQFVVGLEVERAAQPFPRAWEIDSVGTAALGVARDSFGVDLGGYARARVEETERVAGFARVDWRLAENHHFGIRGNYAAFPAGGPTAVASRLHGPGIRLEGSDLSAAATLMSNLGELWVQEIRLGASRSVREYLAGADGIPATRIVAGGLAFGTDPILPGRFERTGFDLSQVLHYRHGAHRLKAGVALSVTSYKDAFAASGGEFVFSGTDAFARREGVFTLDLGSPGVAEFSSPRYGIFVQNTWTATPGLDLTVGIRYDAERLPVDEVSIDTTWARLTGTSNARIPGTVGKLSPRFGFTWDLENRHRWVLHGAAGVYHDRIDPSILGEILTHDGGPRRFRAVGDLGSWPSPTALPLLADTGKILTILGPDFTAPRTVRATLGLSRALGAGTAVHLSGTFRRTDFLPRRRDLNLPAAADAEDQYGRPIYGELVRQGELLTAVPGSNRRFGAYDRVSAISADGRSDYRAVTVGLERRVAGPIDFFASYTYSRTEDDGAYGFGMRPDDRLLPFPAAFGESDWSEGRSDFDVPHRVAVGAEWTLPVASGIRIAGLYRYRSGDPFTPGFRDGVDANGDGSDRNDPAFVDDQVAGIAELLDQWECLREQVGRFAERNACRMPGVHALDLRLGIGLPRFAGIGAELVIDAFNVIESDVGLPDRALYRIDESRELTVDPATGRLVVPLVANPHFGELLQRWGNGRILQIGLRLGY